MSEPLLLYTLKQLVLAITGKNATAEMIVDLEDLLEGNGLDDENYVPIWVPQIFQALTEKKIIPATQQTPAIKEGASYYNFFDELSQIIPMKWVEYGEYFLMQFPPLDLEAKISLEDNSYEVRAITKTV